MIILWRRLGLYRWTDPVVHDTDTPARRRHDSASTDTAVLLWFIDNKQSFSAVNCWTRHACDHPVAVVVVLLHTQMCMHFGWNHRTMQAAYEMYYWPWMTLNGVVAVLFFAESGSFRSLPRRQTGWVSSFLIAHQHILRYAVPYSDEERKITIVQLTNMIKSEDRIKAFQLK